MAHSVLSELVVFNLSNLFDRITPAEARALALDINQIVHAYPLNHYITVFRDDAGARMNNHSYTVFCNHLTQELWPVNEQMPFAGKFHYAQGETTTPTAHDFMYEIRTNQ